MRKVLLVLLVCIFLSPCFVFAVDETLTMTTYYPSPKGAYKELILYPTTSSSACNAQQEGKIYYNATSRMLEVCSYNGASYAYTSAPGGGNGTMGASYWAKSGNDIYNNNTGAVKISTTVIGNNITGDTDLLVNGRLTVDLGSTTHAAMRVLTVDEGTGLHLGFDKYSITENKPQMQITAWKAPASFESIGINPVPDCCGLVGVGITWPRAKLHVASLPTSGSSLVFLADTANSYTPGTNAYTGLSVSTNKGYVGVGIKNPTCKLEIADPQLGEDAIPYYISLKVLPGWVDEGKGLYRNYSFVTLDLDGYGTLAGSPWAENRTLHIRDHFSVLGNTTLGDVQGCTGKVNIEGNLVVGDDMAIHSTGYPALYGALIQGAVVIGPWRDPGGYMLYVQGNAYTTGTWGSSDKKFKKNIAPLKGNVLDKLKNINAVNFEWRKEEFPDFHFSNGKQIGIVADDVEKEFPELVSKDSLGYKGLAYDKFTAVLLEAVKEQQKEISELKEITKRQQEQIEALKKR